MTISEYEKTIQDIAFDEYPHVITGDEPPLASFINFDQTDSELKIYLCKLIICRCFTPTGGIYWPEDAKWFITNFFRSYETDHIKSWLTNTIKEAAKMILSEDTFTQGIIGTTFMFGVIEFYIKYELGFRPNDYDFFDSRKKDYIQPFLKGKNKIPELSIGKAIRLLQATNIELAHSLNDIDNFNTQRLQNVGIEEGRWISAKISDRLSLARNTMLHGENHSFYDKGQYLIMLYILFHFHRSLKDDGWRT